MAIMSQLTPGREAKEAAVRDLLGQPEDEFLKVALAVVEENRELHEQVPVEREGGAA